MKLTRIIGGLLFGWLLMAACTKRETNYFWSEDAPRVVAIDSLLQQQPDSALAYLEGFANTGYGGVGVPYNHYLNLMLSEAAFKVRKEVVLAEEVGAATTCFDSMAAAHPQADNIAFLQARAHYMNAICINNGTIFTDDSLTMMACQEYYKALEIMEQRFNDEQIAGHKASFMALIYARLANIYSDKFLIEPTVCFYKNVLKYKKKANNPPSSLANTLFFLGYEFEKSEQFDSALYYYDQSLACIKDTAGVLYRNVINRKALSSYQVEHDALASVDALKRIASVGNEFEKCDRYLGIGYIYKLDKQYDSAIVYLNGVFEEAPSLFLRTQSADYLREIYEEVGDSERAGEFARFVAQNTPPEFGTKADEWRYTSLFQSYLKQQQERNMQRERSLSQIKALKWIVMLLLVLSALLVWLFVYRRRHKRVEAEKVALSGQLQQQEEALSAMKKCVEAASFAEEPVCRLIMERVNEGQFKSKVDYIIYKDYALTKEQLLALREAADSHFGEFTKRLKKEYPTLTKGDIDYCCLYLLGLNDADIAALMQRAFNTVCERDRKLKAIFGSDEPLSTTLREVAKSNVNP
jgi:tetratricopeptide (TPR) repeat protein